MIKLSHLAFLAFSLAAITGDSAAEFKVEGPAFVLDGKPFQIRSGEIHYPRVPREEWSSRILMAKAMGLNTISTYVFWNLHESKRGEYDFSGEKDVVAFVKLCGELGMHAIVRPGPYVCAEWDLGGLPGWLLADPDIKLRSTDARYLEPAKDWMRKMGSLLQPLTVAEGGPLLMVQIENEFGSFGSDPEYLDALQAALRGGGYQGTVFTCDTASENTLRKGGRPGVLQSANFGGAAERAFQNLQRVRPGQPNLTMEFWVGWFDQWGRPHHVIEPREKIADLEWMMRTGASFNLYMFHGGTTRGLWTGANWENRYRPTTDSYDYSAPLDESGRPTAKYHAFRSVIQSGLKEEKLPDIPKIASTGRIGTLSLTEQCRLSDALPDGTTSPVVQTMETLGQSTGFLLYRMQLQGPIEGELNLGKVKDRVLVLLDGELQGVSGRSTNGAPIPLKVPAGNHKLELLVENMGRINFGAKMLEERKGLTQPVLFAGSELGPFEQIGLPMQEAPDGDFQEIEDGKTHGSCTLYRGKFKTASPSCDTYLDMRGFGRGIVWLNGRNLGRYWQVGPSQSIYLPGSWMKRDGDNEIVVMELEAKTCPAKVPTSANAVWGNEPSR
jgi:beta-galactosidase